MAVFIALMIARSACQPEALRVRLKIIRNARIKIVGKYQPCMGYKLLIIFKRTRSHLIQLYNSIQLYHTR